ncbi:MAG: hypothetical protein QOH47_692 [Sphingomonadales bacterium]|jgi:uncharacterized membrane protein|nr:hypothetical protein [Sphingomonadales bacterium]
MLRRWPIVLAAAAAAACAGKAGNDVGANQANIAADRTAPADNGAAAANDMAGNTANAASAAVSTATYEANGTEPFWALAVAGGRMTYAPSEGTPIIEPLPAQTPIPNGYRYQGVRLDVSITHASCNNGMSDRQYADTVTVTVAGETRNGCGGASTGPD